MIATYGERVAVGLDMRGTTLAERGLVKEGGDLWETIARLDVDGCARYSVTEIFGITFRVVRARARCRRRGIGCCSHNADNTSFG